MSRLRLVGEVARWEFRRYFKLRQQLLSMLFTVGGGLVGYFGYGLLAGDDDPVTVAVVVGEGVELPDVEPGRVHLRPRQPERLPALLDSVRSGDLAAVLYVPTLDAPELVTGDPGRWVDDLRALLRAANTRAVLAETGVDPEVLTRALRPPELRVRGPDEAAGEDEAGGAERTGARLALLVGLGGMIFTLLTGAGYIFMSITGEKQARVTEQVLSAIPPQPWIDGKILGLAAVSAASVLNLAGSGAVVMAIFLKPTLALPHVSPADLALGALFLLFAVVGFFFWFSYLAALAALVDDPQTSQKGGFLMVPMAATALAFLVLRDADGVLARVLALLPPSAPAAMPARILLAEVHPLEVALSLALLAAGTVLLRRVAGRIFSVAMLMHGREASWSEVRRWLTSKS